ncbi:MAG: hypothetical protein M1825_001582 [Sarcosagium campestre]|nr:MAG: hypothetical protein M1825_001582 [Sarcosagium campestre]
MDGTTPVVGGPGRGPIQNWQYGFCDFLSPFNTCCLGYWCPCILFGKTQQRIKDPALQNYEVVNGNCMGWAALGYCGCFWILQMIKRGEMREQYNIDGSGAGDCFGAYCCPLCGLMQEEKEVIHRTQGAAPVPVTAAQGYQKNESTMQYGGQNPQP